MNLYYVHFDTTGTWDTATDLFWAWQESEGRKRTRFDIKYGIEGHPTKVSSHQDNGLTPEENQMMFRGFVDIYFAGKFEVV